MLNEQTQPMTAEEYYNTYMEGKNSVNIYRFAEAYHAYRLAFEKQQQQPSDPYWSDPATWPEWANWSAVDEDGEMWHYESVPHIHDVATGWLQGNNARFEFSHNVSHNPDWRNSLRSREEVSGGK